MKPFKRLGLSITLLAVLFTVASAGETAGPPCIPGETGSPPCSQSVTDGSIIPGETSTPPSSSVDVVDIVAAVRLTLALF